MSSVFFLRAFGHISLKNDEIFYNFPFLLYIRKIMLYNVNSYQIILSIHNKTGKKKKILPVRRAIPAESFGFRRKFLP